MRIRRAGTSRSLLAGVGGLVVLGVGAVYRLWVGLAAPEQFLSIRGG